MNHDAGKEQDKMAGKKVEITEEEYKELKRGKEFLDSVKERRKERQLKNQARRQALSLLAKEYSHAYNDFYQEALSRIRKEK